MPNSISKKTNYNCEQCNKTFYSKCHLKRHLTSHDKKYNCTICNQILFGLSNLRNHLRLHYSANSIICKVCNRNFSSKACFDRHMRIHSGERHFSCEKCPKTFYRDCSLKRHLLIHTNEKLYQCDMCGMSFRRKDHLTTHENIHNDKCYNCEHCKRKFNHRCVLLKHIARHTGNPPYKCKYCLYSFSTKCLLLQHMHKHKSKIKSTECPYCDSSFHDKRSLQRHLASVTGKTSFECPMCFSSFSTLCKLKKHNITMHKGTSKRKVNFKKTLGKITKPKTVNTVMDYLHCSECDINFFYKKAFSHHMSTHVQKWHKCDRCLQNFSSNTELLNHNCPKNIEIEQKFFDKIRDWNSSFKQEDLSLELDENDTLNYIEVKEEGICENYKNEEDEPYNIASIS